MNQDERDIIDTYAFAVSEVLPLIGCSTFHPERRTTLSCGLCPACRIRQRQQQVENIANGVGYYVLAPVSEGKPNVITCLTCGLPSTRGYYCLAGHDPLAPVSEGAGGDAQRFASPAGDGVSGSTARATSRTEAVG